MVRLVLGDVDAGTMLGQLLASEQMALPDLAEERVPKVPTKASRWSSMHLSRWQESLRR
jgi:hypothetical protein